MKKKINVSVEQIYVADDNINCIPLLKSIDTKQAKMCQKAFKFIVKYCHKTEKNDVDYFAQMIKQNNFLIDEVYLQLYKQTRNNQSVDSEIRAWDLILVMSTCFMCTKLLLPFVKQILAIAANGTNKRVAATAQLSYIRFQAQFYSFEPPQYSDEYIKEIPSHTNNCKQNFGVSLFEIMWRQRIDHPKLPIPLFVYDTLELLKKKGAFENEGAFSTPGNKNKIQELVKMINNGKC